MDLCSFYSIRLSSTEHKNNHMLLSPFPEGYFIKILTSFLLSFLDSFSLPAASGLAGWPGLQKREESTLLASQQMAVWTYVR